MDGLRYSLFAPSATTFMMLLGCVTSMKEMIKTRYAAQDDDGKTLLPHPYAPWAVDPTITNNPKYKEKMDKAYRAFKMFENVKEWTFMSLPIMWLFSIYGGELPYMTPQVMDGIVFLSGVAFVITNHWFTTGYIAAQEQRLTGFKARLKVVQFWLFAAAVSLVWYGAKQRLGFF